MKPFYQRKINNVTIQVYAEPEYEPDLSWDESGEVIRGIRSGMYVVFCARVRVQYGPLSADEYLGECIFREYSDFVNESGYYRDMVCEAISTLRKAYSDATSVHNRLRQVSLGKQTPTNLQDA